MKLFNAINANKITFAVSFIGLSVGAYFALSRRKAKRPTAPPREKGEIIHVFFGSQTGTAETFAKELVEEANLEFGLKCMEVQSVDTVDDWDSFLGKSGNSKIFIVFLLSTYGEGDASDDASGFDEWLKSSSLADMAHVNYAIFGLGNKQYALFNEMAKRTERNLKRLGATKMCPTGFGDDNEDIERDFTDWRSNLFWRSLLTFMGIDYESARGSAILRNPIDKCVLDLHIAEKRSKLPFDATVQSFGNDVLSKQFFASSIVPVKRVAQLCHGKSQVDVDISKVPSLRYRSGDTLEVLPLNRHEDVDFLLSLYGLAEKRDFMISFTRKKSVHKTTVRKLFPTPCGLQAAVKKYLDLHGSPSRAFIRDIALVTGHSPERAEQMADEIKKASQDEVWTVIRVLREKFPSIQKKISFSDLIQLIPKQKARAYTICSSPLIDPKAISLVISRVDDNALASVFLTETIKANDLVSVTLKQGSFRLPSLPGQPVIMIAVGTGIAPFRAFLADLTIKGRCENAVLFFGCRNVSEWIYRSEMESFKAEGGQLHIAFSREVERRVVYVQDLIKMEADNMRTLIDRNALVYVCGSTKMGLSVMEEFDRSIADVSCLRAQKRYFEELWG